MVADFYHLDAIPIITLELMRGACGFRDMAQVLQLVRAISAVIITITDEGFINAEPILTGKLFLIAGGVQAVPLITVVTTVIVPVTPVGVRDTPSIITNEVVSRARPPGAVLPLIKAIITVFVAVTHPILGNAPTGGRLVVYT